MARDAALLTPVQLPLELVDLATRVLKSIAAQETILVRTTGELVDWSATAQQVLCTANHVYFSLFLIQAKREHRGIVAGTIELARWRREAVICLERIRGKRPTADEILSNISSQARVDAGLLQPLCEPIRRDLARLNGARTRKPAKSEPIAPSPREQHAL